MPTIAGYEYRVNEGSPHDLGLADTVAGGLLPETTYRFEVRAYDSDGNRGRWTAVALATTLSDYVLTDAAGDVLLDDGGNAQML